MQIVEITVQEWNELNYSKDNYFCNGCVFNKKTDNLIAFGHYEDELHEAGKFYKIVKKVKVNESDYGWV